MFEKFTEIERIYIEKFNINTHDLSLDDRMKITENAYEWISDIRHKFGDGILFRRKEFLEWLRQYEG